MTVLLLLFACTSGSPKDSGAISCGELSCEGETVCLRETYSPECVNRVDTAEPCPEGTTPSMCGGAGIPCCCEPAPAATYQCVSASACSAEPACDCLGEVCPEDKECTSVSSPTSGLFSCDELAKP